MNLDDPNHKGVPKVTLKMGTPGRDAFLTGYALALFPGSCAGEEEREPGTHPW